MGTRRMFSKTIVRSDAFLDMPLSTQALYFQLGMEGDDDGFVSNAKSIARTIGANGNDFDLLLAKRFIIQLDSGIVVIKHWRINNYIQKDRYKPTDYIEQKECLSIKENGSYTEKKSVSAMTKTALDTGCIQDGYTLDTQDKLSKDKLSKVNIKIELDKTRYKQPALLGLLLDFEYLTEESLDSGWDEMLDGFVREHGFADTKIKVNYVLSQLGKLIRNDKDGRPSFKCVQDENKMPAFNARYSYLKKSMESAWEQEEIAEATAREF